MSFASRGKSMVRRAGSYAFVKSGGTFVVEQGARIIASHLKLSGVSSVF